MADNGDADVYAIPVKSVSKKKGLPSITGNTDKADNNELTKPPKRKKTKPVTESELQLSTQASPETALTEDTNENKPKPKQRKQRPKSQTRSTEDPPASTSEDKPVRKKKKAKLATTEQEVKTPTAEEAAEKKDVEGSKTSLITKEEETPKKKQPRKKKKAKQPSSTGADDFGETPWAEDLRTMTEDIISTGRPKIQEQELGDTATEEKKQPLSFITPPVLRSQPLDKIFIETSSRFKGQSKSSLTRQQYEEATRPIQPVIVTRTTTIDFALASHRVLRVVTLFLHGLTAGLSLWHMVMVYILSSFNSDDFLQHYYRVSLPLHCSYYFLLIILTVSACDRFDLGNPSRRFVLRAFTLQNGAVAIVFSLVALILNVVLIKYDDRMYLYKEFTDLYANESEKASDISTFQSINTARSAFIILTWLVLSITPNSDRLGKNLRSGEIGLEQEHDLEKISAA